MEVIWRPSEERARAHERDAARAQARLRRLRLARALLGRGARTLLARGDRGHGARVLAAVGRACVDESRGPEWATWFVGGRLNLAWNCVHRWAHGERARRGRRGLAERGRASGARSPTASCRTRSRASPRRSPRLGVEPGDRVAIFLPMSPEVAIASHACAHLGAIQVPVFSGFAAPAIAQRLQHSEAKVVVTADGSLRRGPRGADEGARRRGARGVAVGRARRRLAAARRTTCRCRPGRDVFWDEALRGVARASSSRSRSTPSTRTCSPTPRARPARRRACSTCRAASSSRSRARSPTRPTRSPAT